MAELPKDIQAVVGLALDEDIGPGDITAALVPADSRARAIIISRESAVLCGSAWVNEVYRQLDTQITLQWHCADGDAIRPDDVVCELAGPARTLLTGERTALNFLQCLSGTATLTRHYVERVEGSGCRILDTRKTIPGLRSAQKYAVACGGGVNHRMGLYDAVLIKENHIIAAGGIAAAVSQAKTADKKIQVEVETLEELQQAIDAGADAVLLDNFSIETLRQAVSLARGRITLEASGGIDETTLGNIAATGVDYISIGALTKHVKAIDFSMRFTTP